VPIELAAPSLPKPIARIVTQMLQKNPDDRPASAEKVLTELDGALLLETPRPF